MPFDPFGDFESRGYLRNVAGEKDLEIVRRLEHLSFTTGLDDAFKRLSGVERLTYRDVLATHRVLFEAVYPWAGEDRTRNAPEIAVSRGGVLFAHPEDIRRAVDTALSMGQALDVMRQRPGEAMGYLAYAHPFLDGNGRTIMVVHAVLAQRAGIAIDWASTDKGAYLEALTKEIENPGHGHLDDYLRPFVRSAVAEDRLAGHIREAPGLSGVAGTSDAEDTVLGKVNEPAVQERYEAQRMKREKSEGRG